MLLLCINPLYIFGAQKKDISDDNKKILCTKVLKHDSVFLNHKVFNHQTIQTTMEGLSINLFGIYGLCAVILIAGAWVFDTSPGTGKAAFFFGILISIGVAISDVSAKHRRLNIIQKREGFR